MKKIKSDAFTLIELVTVIGIIVVIALGATRLDFDALSDKQNVDLTVTKIVSRIETARNNSLLGKAIGNPLEVPQKYEISVTSTGSGDITSKYSTGEIIDNYLPYDDGISLLFGGNQHTRISQMRCLQIDDATSDSSTGTGIVIFEGSNISLSGSCNQVTSKILEIEVSKRLFTKKVKIHIVNGTITVE